MTRGVFHFLHTSTDRSTGVAVRQLSTIPMGQLALPSGRLLIEDPFRSLRSYLNRSFTLPPGIYRAVQTVARIGEDGEANQYRAAYLSLILDEDLLEERRKHQQALLAQGLDPQISPTCLEPLHPDLPNDSLSEQQWRRMAQPSVFILTGTVALADQERFELLMPSDEPESGEQWLETVFEHGLPGSWFDALDASAPLPAGSASVGLPHGEDLDRVILCQTGWGDGQYAIVVEHTEQGQPIALHIDFGVIPSDPMLSLRG